MAGNLKISDVWQEAWGARPEADGVLSVDLDTSKPPALWPDTTETEGLLVAPILNNGQWLSLVKIQDPEAINPLQKQALLAVGFREGNAGRLIHPAYPTPHLVEMLSKILRLPLDTLQGDQVVTLSPSDRFEPAIPLEVQAGIRELWKKRPDVLTEEILISLREQEDNLSLSMQKLLEGAGEGSATPSAIQNPLRLQVWVSQALSGELNAITETILSLGLQRGTVNYGPSVADWPQDCQALHKELADFRGDRPVLDAPLIPRVNDIGDARPPLRTRIKWMEDNTRHEGTIVGLPEDESEVWVVPLEEQAGGPKQHLSFYVPYRRRVPVSAIVEPQLPSQSAALSEQTGGLFGAVDETIEVSDDQMEAALFGESASDDMDAPSDTELMTEQAPVTLAELPNRSLAQRARNGILQNKLQTRIRNLAMSGVLMGKHPLAVMPGDFDVDLVVSWREIDADLYQYNDASAARLDAETLVRDTLIEQFNQAQPKTVNGERLPLAVLPAGHHQRGADPLDPATQRILEQLEFCRVGFHPLLLPEILDRVDTWANTEAQALKASNPDLAAIMQESALGFRTESMTLNQCGLLGLGDHSVRAVVQDVYRTYYSVAMDELGRTAGEYEISLAALEVLASEEGKAAIVKKTGHNLFANYQEAADFIAGRHPRVAELAEKNRGMFGAIADLTKTSQQEVEKTAHPLMVLMDVLEDHGIEATDRSELLAKLNIDLTERMNWVGQIATIHGASVDMAYTSTLTEKPTDSDSKAFQELGMSPHTTSVGLARMAVTSGFLRVGEERRPFQFAVLAEAENLFKQKLKGENLSESAPHIVIDSDRLNGPNRESLASLGQVVDLHRMTALKLGEPLEQNGQVIKVEQIDALEPTIYGVPNLHRLSQKPVSSRAGIGSVEGVRVVDGEVTDTGYTSAADISAFIRKNREVLLTGSPVWRTDKTARQSLQEAITLFQQGSKHLQNLARPGRVIDHIIEELSRHADSEILVMATKSSRSRTKWITEVVTKKDLLAADNDRALATEHGILRMKQGSPSVRSGYQFIAFDLAQTLRPEAIRYLNELREEHARQNGKTEDEDTKPKRRGARQDRGSVAGLAIKDLRGKSSVVLGTLSEASAGDQKKFITKTKLWEAPDWAFLRAPSDEDCNEGARPMAPVVAAFFDELRKRLNPGPPANIPDVNQLYARFVLGVRDAFDDIRTESELEDALKKPDGRLAKLEGRFVEDAMKHGFEPNVIIGDCIVSRYDYRRSESAFEQIQNKANRRSLNNTRWDIKEAKPGTGRRPEINNRGEIMIDGDDERELSGAMPMLSQLVRKGGEDYRAGLDVSEETVIKTFGFSGIEYGKSMSQIDRSTYLNEAYDGFMDLSKLLDVPPQALSLGGTLGLAFGSRGRGGRNAALAHFEPGNNAINLTRMKGAGSMAHEYGHAFANYMFRVSRGLEGSRAPGDITKVMGHQIDRKQAILAGNLRQPVADAIASVLRNIKYQPVKDSAHAKETKFVRGAYNADAADGRSHKNPYWPTIEELFARAFETYVSVALKDKYPDFRNDFLVRDDKLAVWGIAPYSTKQAAEEMLAEIANGDYEKKNLPEDPTDEQKEDYRRKKWSLTVELRKVLSQPQLYPAGEEMDRIKKAFDHLFETLETKEKKVRHDHLGEIEMPVLYSAGSGIAERITPRDHSVIAECVLGEIARMCGREVWVNWQDEMTDSNGNPVAGRYSKKSDTLGKLHSVIDLAYGAGIHTAHHEAFHFAQDNLLEPAEQAMLDRFFASDSPLMQRLRESLINDERFDTLAIVETNPLEAQAYAYEQWVKGKLDVKVEEPPVGVFGRVQNFFGRVFGLADNAGFKTPEQLFQAFYQGHLRDRLEQRADLTQQHNSGTAMNATNPGDGADPKKAQTQGHRDHNILGSDSQLWASDPEVFEDEYRPGF